MTRMSSSAKRRWIATLTLGLLGWIGAPAHASSIAYDFQGFVNFSTGADDIQEGDLINGSFHFDADLTPSTDAGTAPRYYTGNIELQFQVGDHAFEISQPISRTVVVDDEASESPGIGDSFGIVVLGHTSDPDFQPDSLSFGLVDSTGTAFTDDLLPHSFDLADFSRAVVLANVGPIAVAGTVETLTPYAIPEPATVAILGLGMAGLILAHRRRARQAD